MKVNDVNWFPVCPGFKLSDSTRALSDSLIISGVAAALHAHLGCNKLFGCNALSGLAFRVRGVDSKSAEHRAVIACLR